MNTTGTRPGAGLSPLPQISIPPCGVGWGGLVIAPCVFCFTSSLWVWPSRLLESSCLCLQRAQKLLAEVSRERGELQGERGELRGRLARLELERAQLEMQSQQLRESNQQLDLSACRLTTQCEVWHSVRAA